MQNLERSRIDMKLFFNDHESTGSLKHHSCWVFFEHADIEAYRGYISDYMLYVVFLSHHGNLIKSMYCSSLCPLKNNKQYINSSSLKSSTNSQQKCTPTSDHIKIILQTIILINNFSILTKNYEQDYIL